jgi:hypothetical protein
MSIDFWIPQAPVEQYRPFPEDDPDWLSVRPVEPFTELNMANDNAYAFLRELGCHGDCGEWNADELDRVYRKLMVLRNGTAGERLETPDVKEQNFYMMGRHTAYVQDRLDRLLAIVKAAREHGFSVVWG